MKYVFVLAVSMLFASIAGAQTSRAEWISKYLEAHNSGERARIDAFAAEAGVTSGQLWRLVRELGPAELEQTQGEFCWLRGSISQSILGVRLRESDQGVQLVGIRSGGAPDRPTPLAVLEGDALKAHLHQYLSACADAGLFSGAVAVARGDDVIFEGAFGIADRAAGRANDTETQFRLASISKMFVAVATLQLVDQGMISLDDTISRFLPDYPERVARQVTVRHLLTHTSGIEIDEDERFNRLVEQADSLDEIYAAQIECIERMNDNRYENFAPLGRFDYSNENYDLLGIIIQRITGLTWEEYLREKVFAPSGMSNTGFYGNHGAPASLSAGYTSRLPGAEEAGGTIAISREQWDTPRPAGGVCSTAGDMARFARALLSYRLLSKESTDAMLSPQAEVVRTPDFTRSYGLGSAMHASPRWTSVGHTGSVYGASTSFEMYRESGHVIVVLCNIDGWMSQPVADYIREVSGAR